MFYSFYHSSHSYTCTFMKNNYDSSSIVLANTTFAYNNNPKHIFCTYTYSYVQVKKSIKCSRNTRSKYP